MDMWTPRISEIRL